MVTTPEGYAAAAFVLAVSLFVLRWTNKHQNDWLDDCQKQVNELRDQLDEANRRVDILADACRKGGVTIPHSVWDGHQTRRRSDGSEWPDT